MAAPLAVRLRPALAAAAEDVALIAALRFALPTELLAVLAAAGAASALNLPPVADVIACAEATLAIAPTLVFAERACAAGATTANELRLPLADTSAGA